MSYLYEAACRRCFYQVYFDHSSAGVGWAWLCGFVGVLIEEVLVSSPPHESNQAAVDQSGVMGSSTAACLWSHSSTGTSALWLYSGCGWNVRLPPHLRLYCLLNSPAQMLNQKTLIQTGVRKFFFGGDGGGEFCGSCPRMTGCLFTSVMVPNSGLLHHQKCVLRFHQFQEWQHSSL